MMNDQKPLAAQVAAILELRPGASDGDILARVGEWACERKQQQDSAAFERRVVDLMRVTNMPREQAARCLAAQDAAAQPAEAKNVNA
jgi:hypothetical protein